MNEKIEYQPVSVSSTIFCQYNPEVCIKYNSLLTKEAEEEYLNQWQIWRESDSGRKIIQDFNETRIKAEIQMIEQMESTKENFPKVRYDICNSCENFNSFTKFCGECHCFMPVKVLFKNVKCPVNKWQEEK